MTHTPKILVIRFSSIGDIVLSSPLLRVLRKKFPAGVIDYVTRSEFAELVRFNQNLNLTHTYDRNSGFIGLIRLAIRLRREKYELVVDIHNSLRSRILRALIGAPDTVTIDKRIRERRLLVRTKENRYKETISVAERYVESVASFGVTDDGRGLELHIPDVKLATVRGRVTKWGLASRDAVFGFCPGARHFTKRWPEERYAELGARLVRERNALILLFGGPDERDLCQGIVKKINETTGKEGALNLCGELDLLETGAAMEYCDALVCNDSGLMHVAAAMGRPLVAIFGSTVREFGFFPIGKLARVVERPDVACRPCSHIGRAACPEGHFRCMQEIEVAHVADELESLVRTKGHE